MADINNSAPVAAAPDTSNSSVDESTSSDDTSAAETVSDPAKDTSLKAAVKANTPQSTKKKLKLKIDNREVEEEFDPNDDEYMTRQLQLAKVAQKRMGEYATLQKQVDAFINELKKDPRKILSNPNIGVDIKKLAASVIEEEIANSQKSPEQLKSEKLENELKALKEQHEAEKNEAIQKEQERLTEQAYERYDVQMTKALESSDLPKSPYVIKKMSEYMILGLKNGVDVTPEDVLPLVRDEISEDLKQMFNVMPEEVIEKIIGKDVFTKIRKKNLANAKKAPPTPVNKLVADAGGQPAKPKTSEKKLTYRDYFKV